MRQYLAVLWRNLRRERLYAAINIAGLSLGIACCLILGQFLRKELSYDRHNLQYKQIYRVVNEFTTGASAEQFAVTSQMLGPLLKEQYPEIKAFVRFQHNGNTRGRGTPIRKGDQVYYWEDTYWVDDNVFDVFTPDVIYGDPKTALKQTSTIAVSETFAKTYFGDANPIGEIVTTEAGTAQKITLVFRDLPANSHLKYDMLFSRNVSFLQGPDDASMRRQWLWGFGNFTYVLMDPQFKPTDWPRINDDFYKRFMEDIGRQRNSHWKSWLQPLADIHLYSDVSGDLPTRNRMYLYGCAAVAVFILLVACINYMNLATARATRRARSVGIRKILGASRASLALQFLGEAIGFSLIALVIGVAIVKVALALTPLNNLMDHQVSLDLLHDPGLLGWLIGLGVLMGLLAGAYPAIYLSSWAPLTALTGTYLSGKLTLRVREALVVLQFTISAAVIAATLLMVAQMRYVAAKDLGFSKENRLVVTLRGLPTIEKIPTIRAELARNSHILGMSEVAVMLGQETNVNTLQIEGNGGVMEPNLLAEMPIGEEFVQVMGLKILQGRDFSRHLLTDVGTNVLVNEALVRKMGWTEPLGKRLQFGNEPGRVIGVVRDFNFKSLHTLVEPFLMYPLDTDYSRVGPVDRPFMIQKLVLNISGQDVSQTVGFVERVVQQADPRHPFEFEFLDAQLDKLYKDEHQLTRLIGIFAGICIFIACLGLFGLAAFATEQRTREIGTRKVLGATSMQIIVLLAKRILLLVAIASVLASVVAYFAVEQWLTGFAYRAGINFFIFVLAAAAAAAVTFITVALQSYKTASADPVEALRHV